MSGPSRAAPRVDPAIAEMLLSAVAAAPTGPMAKVFDEVLYPFVKHFAVTRAASLARRTLRRLDAKDVYLPGVLPADQEAVAHDAATLALQRLRTSAGRFDRTKGDVLSWISRAALFAYSDVVRALYRRTDSQFAVKDKADPLSLDTASLPSAEARVLVREAMRSLSDDERNVIALRYRYEFTYEEMAEIMFGDASDVKRLEHLLAAAMRKMKHTLNRNQA